jgi:hypothetical protein
MLADAGLELALPSGIPTHIHNVTKKWMRLDQVFISDHSTDMIISCGTRADQRGIKTDHIPIVTELNLAVDLTETTKLSNFRKVDWEQFRHSLINHLSTLDPPRRILTQQQLDKECNALTTVLQDTICDSVPLTTLGPKSRRWWTKELTMLRKHVNKLGRNSFQLRAHVSHRIHMEHKEATKEYSIAIKNTKQQHWRDWLEKVEDPDIWTAHKLISAAPSDGGKARIPVLKYSEGREEKLARSNSKKGEALAKAFFPKKLLDTENGEMPQHTMPCSTAPRIMREQIGEKLQKLKPYKAPGPDKIPNIVLTKCADLIVCRLHHIYN